MLRVWAAQGNDTFTSIERGDVRRICELFDLGVDAALRYVTAVDQP